tara:strand:- start:132 stop:683 length:552 start_codon:yes stop_codon:yes gene_type:complete
MMEKLPLAGSIEAKDNFAASPPGHSLTIDNERWPWGKPQEQADPQAVLDKAVDSLDVPSVRDEMMKLLMVGASVEALVEGYIFQAFQDGGFSPDVGLLIKGPLALYIASVAEEENIPYRMFENEDALTEGEMDDRTFFTMMRDNNPAMFDYVNQTLNEGIRRGSVPTPPAEENFMNMSDKKDS